MKQTQTRGAPPSPGTSGTSGLCRRPLRGAPHPDSRRPPPPKLWGNTLMELFLSHKVCLICYGKHTTSQWPCPTRWDPCPAWRRRLAQAWGALSLHLLTQCGEEVGRREGGGINSDPQVTVINCYWGERQITVHLVLCRQQAEAASVPGSGNCKTSPLLSICGD